MAVKAIDHSERGHMFATGQGDRRFQLVLQVLCYLSAIDPEFHAFGDTVQSVSRAAEGKRAANHLAIARGTDMYSELNPGQGTVRGGVGIPQHVGASRVTEDVRPR